MKIKILILIAIISLNVNFSFAQSNEIHLFSKPKEVTVYPKGAMVNYQFNVNLKKGINRLIIDSLPSELDKDLILTSLSGENVIISSEYIYDYDVDKNTSKYEKLLLDSISQLQKYLNDIYANLEGLKKEKILIADFKYEQKSEKINQLKELIDFSPLLSKRITEIRKEINRNEHLENEYSKELEDVQKKYNLYVYKNYISNQSKLILEVLSENNDQSELKLSYYTNKASWALLYDLKVEKINKPLKLVYKAMVKQKTGVNWDNINITFSNKSLEINKKLPKPKLWFIREEKKLEREELQATARFGVNQMVELEAGVTQSGEGFSIRGARDTDSFVYSNINNNNLNVEFKLNSNVTIKSTDQYYGFTVENKEIPANYSHYTYPTQSKEAFVIAKITNWNNLNLIGGEANIYFENSYIGKTIISPDEVKDTLDIVLGVDKNISITREITEEMSEDKFLSSSKIQYKGYKIKVRNNSKEKINIKILENYPISTSHNISINLVEISNAENDKDAGLLTWNKNIEPNISEDIKIIYKVDAPEGFRLKQ